MRRTGCCSARVRSAAKTRSRQTLVTWPGPREGRGAVQRGAHGGGRPHRLRGRRAAAQRGAHARARQPARARLRARAGRRRPLGRARAALRRGRVRPAAAAWVGCRLAVRASAQQPPQRLAARPRTGSEAGALSATCGALGGARARLCLAACCSTHGRARAPRRCMFAPRKPFAAYLGRVLAGEAGPLEPEAAQVRRPRRHWPMRPAPPLPCTTAPCARAAAEVAAVCRGSVSITLTLALNLPRATSDPRLPRARRRRRRPRRSRRARRTMWPPATWTPSCTATARRRCRSGRPRAAFPYGACIL
jgi:hypothetical protein